MFWKKQNGKYLTYNRHILVHDFAMLWKQREVETYLGNLIEKKYIVEAMKYPKKYQLINCESIF